MQNENLDPQNSAENSPTNLSRETFLGVDIPELPSTQDSLQGVLQIVRNKIENLSQSQKTPEQYFLEEGVDPCSLEEVLCLATDRLLATQEPVKISTSPFAERSFFNKIKKIIHIGTSNIEIEGRVSGAGYQFWVSSGQEPLAISLPEDLVRNKIGLLEDHNTHKEVRDLEITEDGVSCQKIINQIGEESFLEEMGLLDEFRTLVKKKIEESFSQDEEGIWITSHTPEYWSQISDPNFEEEFIQQNMRSRHLVLDKKGMKTGSIGVFMLHQETQEIARSLMLKKFGLNDAVKSDAYESRAAILQEEWTYHISDGLYLLLKKIIPHVSEGDIKKYVSSGLNITEQELVPIMDDSAMNAEQSKNILSFDSNPLAEYTIARQINPYDAEDKGITYLTQRINKFNVLNFVHQAKEDLISSNQEQ